MRTINKIVESKDEPNTNDLWLKDNKLLVYKEGEWKSLGGESSIEPFSIIDSLNIIKSEESLFYKNKKYSEAYSVLPDLPPRTLLGCSEGIVLAYTLKEDNSGVEVAYLVPGIITIKRVSDSNPVIPIYISYDLLQVLESELDRTTKYLGTSSINASHVELDFYPLLVKADIKVQ